MYPHKFHFYIFQFGYIENNIYFFLRDIFPSAVPQLWLDGIITDIAILYQYCDKICLQ